MPIMPIMRTVPHTKERRLHVVDMYGASHRAIYSLDHGAPIVGLVIPGQHGVDHPSDAHVDQLPWHVYFYGYVLLVLARCVTVLCWFSHSGCMFKTFTMRQFVSVFLCVDGTPSTIDNYTPHAQGYTQRTHTLWAGWCGHAPLLPPHAAVGRGQGREGRDVSCTGIFGVVAAS